MAAYLRSIALDQGITTEEKISETHSDVKEILQILEEKDDISDHTHCSSEVVGTLPVFSPQNS